MLVLSRKKNQSIVIGNDIEISILSIEGDIVKLGIEAPKKVAILRKELIDDVTAANKEAIGAIGDIKDFKMQK